MAFTYSATCSTSKDQVRLLIGDTDVASPLLQDEEITFLLTQWENVYACAAEACRAGAAKLARKVDSTVGDIHLSASQRYEHLMGLIPGFIQRAQQLPGTGYVPFVGGTGRRAVFGLGQFDYPTRQNPLYADQAESDLAETDNDEFLPAGSDFDTDSISGG